MTWVRIDENFAQHPKVVRVGPLGMAMQIAGLCYSNRHLTDGFVPMQIVKHLLDLEGLAFVGQAKTGKVLKHENGEIENPALLETDFCSPGCDAEWQMIVADLVDAGLWTVVEGGWKIHDYLDYQPSKKEIDKKKQAGSKGGQARSKNANSAQAKTKKVLKQKTSKSRNRAQADPVPDTDISSLRSDNRRTPFDELRTVLDEDHARAVLDHRRKIRKPLTVRAAQLLAGQLAKFPDPHAAADTMILRGWLSIDPDWWNKPNGKPNGSGNRFREAAEMLNRTFGRTQDHDEQSVVDITPRQSPASAGTGPRTSQSDQELDLRHPKRSESAGRDSPVALKRRT